MYRFTTSNLDLSGSGSQSQVRALNGYIITAGGAAATVELRMGSAGGTLVATIKIPANTTVTFGAGSKPLVFTGGIFVVPDANVTTGLIF